MNEVGPQERDVIASRRVGLVAVVAIGTAIGGVVVSTLLLRGAPASARPAFPSTTTTAIGIVDQGAILEARRAADERRAQEEALSRYRYLDETHETAEIPVDRAMAIIVERAR